MKYIKNSKTYLSEQTETDISDKVGVFAGEDNVEDFFKELARILALHNVREDLIEFIYNLTPEETANKEKWINLLELSVSISQEQQHKGKSFSPTQTLQT